VSNNKTFHLLGNIKIYFLFIIIHFYFIWELFYFAKTIFVIKYICWYLKNFLRSLRYFLSYPTYIWYILRHTFVNFLIFLFVVYFHHVEYYFDIFYLIIFYFLIHYQSYCSFFHYNYINNFYLLQYKNLIELSWIFFIIIQHIFD